MRFPKMITCFILAVALLAAETPQRPPAAGAAPSQQPAPAPSKAKPRKRGGKGKWIALGAVGVAVVVTLVLVEKRLNNEGAGIFH